jgi:inner membrane protein
VPSCLRARKNLDNLTHSLAGAVLGQMGLKTKTGLGMATLIIAANIPDIDAVATMLDGVQHLAIRRGITHGPIAMLVLPLLLTGIMIGFDRWQGKRGKRPADRLPIHKGWLLALAYIGCLSHPALDWLNSYGIRLLEPFSSQWFYGDSIFIIDIWIWAALIAGVWVSRRREKKGGANWQRPAWISFAAVCAYISANGLITRKAEAQATVAVQKMLHKKPDLVVANPVPLAFWRRDVLWRGGYDETGQAPIGHGTFDLTGSELLLSPDIRLDNMDTVQLKMAVMKNPEFKAFLFWSRMPFALLQDDQEKEQVILKDQRFDNPLLGDRFTVKAIVRKDRLEQAVR